MQVARLGQRDQRRPRHDPGLKSLQRPDEVAKRRGLPAEDFVPKGMLNAYNERKKQMAAGGH